jgi:peptidoglycan/LPS O-acetylase OafA/YrhL
MAMHAQMLRLLCLAFIIPSIACSDVDECHVSDPTVDEVHVSLLQESFHFVMSNADLSNRASLEKTAAGGETHIGNSDDSKSADAGDTKKPAEYEIPHPPQAKPFLSGAGTRPIHRETAGVVEGPWQGLLAISQNGKSSKVFKWITDNMFENFLVLHLALAMMSLFSCILTNGSNKAPQQALLRIASAVLIWILCALFTCLQYWLHSHARCVPFVVWSWMGSAVTMVLGAGVMGLVCFVMANLARRSGSERPCVRAPELPKLPRIDVIDGFRVLGISLIILSHQTYNLPAWLALVVERSNNAMHSSEPLLFIVSGFVLMHVMAQKVEHFVLGTGTALIARRLARLLPAYYLALVGCMAFSAGQSKASEPHTWASAATLSQSLIPLNYCDTPNDWTVYFPFGYAGNGPAWFTSAMVILSFCFPPIFNVVRDFDFATSVAWLILVALLRCACLHTMYNAGGEEIAPGRV